MLLLSSKTGSGDDSDTDPALVREAGTAPQNLIDASPTLSIQPVLMVTLCKLALFGFAL